MAIKIDNSVGNFEAYLISPEGINLGLITNVVSLDYVRMQIKKEQAEGYKILFNGNNICINKNGRLEHWPDEFSCHSKILDVLIGLYD